MILVSFCFKVAFSTVYKSRHCHIGESLELPVEHQIVWWVMTSCKLSYCHNDLLRVVDYGSTLFYQWLFSYIVAHSFVWLMWILNSVSWFVGYQGQLCILRWALWTSWWLKEKSSIYPENNDTLSNSPLLSSFQNHFILLCLLSRTPLPHTW